MKQETFTDIEYSLCKKKTSCNRTHDEGGTIVDATIINAPSSTKNA